MKELLEPYLKMALESGAKTAEQAANFVMTQSPELVKEVIMWGWISESIAPCVFFLLALTAIGFHLTFKKGELDENGKEKSFYWCGEESNGTGIFPGVFFNTILLIISSIGFFSQIMDMLYPLVAPRLYLIETLSHLIK